MARAVDTGTAGTHGSRIPRRPQDARGPTRPGRPRTTTVCRIGGSTGLLPVAVLVVGPATRQQASTAPTGAVVGGRARPRRRPGRPPAARGGPAGGRSRTAPPRWAPAPRRPSRGRRRPTAGAGGGTRTAGGVAAGRPARPQPARGRLRIRIGLRLHPGAALSELPDARGGHRGESSSPCRSRARRRCVRHRLQLRRRQRTEQAGGSWPSPAAGPARRPRSAGGPAPAWRPHHPGEAGLDRQRRPRHLHPGQRRGEQRLHRGRHRAEPHHARTSAPAPAAAVPAPRAPAPPRRSRRRPPPARRPRHRAGPRAGRRCGTSCSSPPTPSPSSRLPPSCTTPPGTHAHPHTGGAHRHVQGGRRRVTTNPPRPARHPGTRATPSP